MAQGIKVGDYVRALRVQKGQDGDVLTEITYSSVVEGHVVGIQHPGSVLLVRTDAGEQVRCSPEGASKIAPIILTLDMEIASHQCQVKSIDRPDLEESADECPFAALGKFVLRHADALGIKIIR